MRIDTENVFGMSFLCTLEQAIRVMNFAEGKFGWKVSALKNVEIPTYTTRVDLYFEGATFKKCAEWEAALLEIVQ